MQLPLLQEIIYKELLGLKDFSKEDIEQMKQYKLLKFRKDTEDFLKRHAEDKERFREEIDFKCRYHGLSKDVDNFLKKLDEFEEKWKELDVEFKSQYSI